MQFNRFLKLILNPPSQLLHNRFSKNVLTLALVHTWYNIWSSRNKWILQGKIPSLDHLEIPYLDNDFISNSAQTQYESYIMHISHVLAWWKPTKRFISRLISCIDGPNELKLIIVLLEDENVSFNISKHSPFRNLDLVHGRARNLFPTRLTNI